MGIIAYINHAQGFTGIHKQRYTDFIVREVNEKGDIAKLRSVSHISCSANFPSAQQTNETTNKQEICLETYEKSINDFFTELGNIIDLTDKQEVCTLSREFILQCYNKASECPKEITTFPCSSKEMRTKLHQMIKKYFSVSKL